MKYVIGLVMVLCFFDAHATEIQVKRMTLQNGFDNKFLLKTSLIEKVILDCQSFVQGLTIGEDESQIFYLLEPEDCEALQNRMKTSLSHLQRHCLDLEDYIRSDYTCP